MDRQSPRNRPSRTMVMKQKWEHLLFLHWEVPADLLRRLIPQRLELDTFDGRAWVSVTPFHMSKMRLPTLPPVPVLSTSHEINVRTYVHYDGVPGIWFFSLDADNTAAVMGARIGFSLPYYQARMSMDMDDGRIRFESERSSPRPAAAEFSGTWHHEGAPRRADGDPLEFFLIERYCLYSGSDEKLQRARIHHVPWQITDARVDHLSSTMLEANQIPTPEGEPLVHAQAQALDVEVFLPEDL